MGTRISRTLPAAIDRISATVRVGEPQADDADQVDDVIRLSLDTAIRSVADAANGMPQRSVDVVASTDVVDSYGEIVAQDWDLSRYQRNPVVLYGHRMNDFPIGFAEDVGVRDGKLHARLRFVDEAANPVAERVWQLIQQGALRAVSVGFRSREAKVVEDPQGKQVVALMGNELLEISVVPIPANPDALVLGRSASARSKISALVARSAGGARTTMEHDMQTKQITQALGLADDADDATITKRLGDVAQLEHQLVDMTGAKSIDEAVGIVAAWSVASKRLADVERQLAELQTERLQQQRDALIAQGKAAGKLTPAMEPWARECPIDTLRGFLDVAPAHPVLQQPAHAQPAQDDGAPTDAQRDAGAAVVAKVSGGATWDQLSNLERHALYFADSALYRATLDDHQRRQGTH